MHPVWRRRRIPTTMTSKKVLLIGGNSGIGQAVARRLAAGDWMVSAAARSAGTLVQLGIPVQHFDAEDVPELEIPDVLQGLVYCPGSISETRGSDSGNRWSRPTETRQQPGAGSDEGHRGRPMRSVAPRG